jgi:hypothetical protein
MASPSVDPDIEAQVNSVTETQPPIIPNPPPTTNAADPLAEQVAEPQLPTTADADAQLQDTNNNQGQYGSPPVQQPPDNPQVQRGMLTLATLTVASSNLIRVPDENHGDPSDGLWSMYLTEAEKQDAEVTESWKGDTDGILVFVSPVRAPLRIVSAQVTC